MSVLHNGPDFEGAIKRAREENFAEVLENLESEELNLMRKVKRFSEDFGFEVDSVIEKIREDEMFRAHFAKDPRKQNLDEKTALEWLGNVDEVCQLRKLPIAGKDAYYVDKEGYIRKGSDFETRKTPSKSLDFSWVTGNTKFYAMHKRTTDSGGAQDNVWREVEQIMKNFQQSPQKGVALVMLLDGSYWTPKKIQSVAQFARSDKPQSFALPTPRILPVLRNEMGKRTV